MLDGRSGEGEGSTQAIGYMNNITPSNSSSPNYKDEILFEEFFTLIYA